MLYVFASTFGHMYDMQSNTRTHNPKMIKCPIHTTARRAKIIPATTSDSRDHSFSTIFSL